MTKKVDRSAFTRRQWDFIIAYIDTTDKTEAARRAGYSEKSAKQMGYENCLKPHIRKAIDLLMQDGMKKYDLTIERVAQEIARIALVDPKQLFDDHGRLKNISELDQNLTSTISKLEVVRNKDGEETVRVTLNSKIQALDLAAKYLGMLTGKGENVTEETGVIMMPEKKEPGAPVE